MIATEYLLNDSNKVRVVRWANGVAECRAELCGDSEFYTYHSWLEDDKYPVQAPELMTLADCTLNAMVHLGMIPPHNFASVPCPNAH